MKSKEDILGHSVVRGATAVRGTCTLALGTIGGVGVPLALCCAGVASKSVRGRNIGFWKGTWTVLGHGVAFCVRRKRHTTPCEELGKTRSL